MPLCGHIKEVPSKIPASPRGRFFTHTHYTFTPFGPRLRTVGGHFVFRLALTSGCPLHLQPSRLRCIFRFGDIHRRSTRIICVLRRANKTPMLVPGLSKNQGHSIAKMGVLMLCHCSFRGTVQSVCPGATFVSWPPRGLQIPCRKRGIYPFSFHLTLMLTLLH